MQIKLALLSGMVFCLTEFAAAQVVVPDWALPGSATHKQVPPPTGFHRETKTEIKPLGVFQGQSDVGGALVAGSAGFDSRTGAELCVTNLGVDVNSVPIS